MQKIEWQNQGENLSSVGCILGQSLQYVGDKLFQKIQACYKSLGVPSFDQVNYEADISANQGAFNFASTLTFTVTDSKTHLILIRMHRCMLWDGSFKLISRPAKFKEMQQSSEQGGD
ncbi:hypothetical protein O181_025576 [Austropuccinia psidii MF-1]|uniref:Tet-like 2OG-Fe(II) oxygenase domain-containing protein n=1 Tax=Austropuccinia psidii MF-1 TaxID=1389203 RepID=A0A9Q3GZP2_9BASI|nr:hypothetical protein [Austropuccinia psidii MF-1]